MIHPFDDQAHASRPEPSDEPTPQRETPDAGPAQPEDTSVSGSDREPASVPAPRSETTPVQEERPETPPVPSEEDLPRAVYGQGSYRGDEGRPAPRPSRRERRRQRQAEREGDAPAPDRFAGEDAERYGEAGGRPPYGPGSVPPYGPPPAGGRGPAGYRPIPTRTSPLTVLVAVLLTFVLTASLFSGYIWSHRDHFPTDGGQTQNPSETHDPKGDEGESVHLPKDEKLQEMIRILKDNYYRELTDEEIMEAIIKGFPSHMDSPYTYYLNPEEHQAMLDSIQGEYSGIGATVQMVGEGVYEIVEPTPDSPAAEAGLQPGDRFIKVDGKDAAEFATVQDLATTVKGEAGTEVELEMFRPSTGETLTFTVERRAIVSHPVVHRMLEDDLGYLQIREFSLNLPEAFQLAMRDLLSEGAKHIVFDLRNNPGGAADSAIKVLDYLLPEGTIATIKGRQDGKKTEYQWTSDASMFVPENMTYTILVNRNSASASELFTGTLRDWDKAYIIGEKTYGKGSGTVAYELEDGSALNVTIFNYYLPDGELIEGKGITPDEEVTLPEEALTKIISELTEDEDTQLQAAVEHWHSIR